MDELPPEFQILVLDLTLDFLDYRDITLLKKCISTITKDTAVLPYALLSLFCDTCPMELRTHMLTLLCDQDISMHVFGSLLKRTSFALDLASAEYLFLHACRGGNQAMAQWLADSYDVQNQEEALAEACKHHHTAVAEWLWRRYPLTLFNVSYTSHVIKDAFIWVCRTGHLPLARWLHTHFASLLSSTCIEEAFAQACSQSHLHVLEWIHATFPLTHKIQYLYQGCASGRTTTIEWIVSKFPSLPFEQVETDSIYHYAVDGALRVRRLDLLRWLSSPPIKLLNQNKAHDLSTLVLNTFHKACQGFYWPLVKWLIKHFYIDYDRADRTYITEVFIYVCRYGNLQLAQWISVTFSLQAEHVRAQDMRAFIDACKGGHLDIAKWLQWRFLLTTRDIVKQQNRAFFTACEQGHVEIVGWILDNFSPTAHLCSSESLELRAMEIAATQGHLSLLKELVQRFLLSSPGQKEKSYWAELGNTLFLRVCSSHSDLEMVKWILENCKPISAAIRYKRGFFRASTFGNVQIMQWLARKFVWNRRANDSLVAMGYILGEACRHKFPVPQWLTRQLGVTKKDVVTSEMGRVIERVCYRSQLPTLQWFVSAFRLTAEDVSCFHLFTEACRGGQVQVVKWLSQTFGWTKENRPPDWELALQRSVLTKELLHWLVHHFEVNPEDCSFRKYMLLA